LLIFVSGNLDEMYEDVAKSVQDCDTDADIFNEMTRKLSIIDVKKALNERFKPEQIARLGNEHVIYPSFDRATYQKLIEITCERYLREIESVSHLQFAIDPHIHAEIYKNSVFPSQGTRPLFSSIHAILSAPLVNATLWAIQNGATAQDRIQLTVNDRGEQLVVHLRELSVSYPVRLELNQLKQRTDRDFRALLAVHEAGHGLLYGLLFRHPPQEIKINVAAFEGGYVSFKKQRVDSRQNCLDRICVGLGGRVAEVWIFGQDASTTGAKGDISKATALAAKFIRHDGFEMRLSRTDIAQGSGENLNTDVALTNPKIEALLNEQYARAEELLRANRSAFLKIVHELVEFGEVTRAKFCDSLGIDDIEGQVDMGDYANQLAAFESGINLMQRMAANSSQLISQHCDQQVQ
jgi:cell division protease FtsH